MSRGIGYDCRSEISEIMYGCRISDMYTWITIGNKITTDRIEHKKVLDNGDTFLNGQRHSFDGICALRRGSNGAEWYNRGKLHRMDGPAYQEGSHGYYIQKWYQNGQLHSPNGTETVTESDCREGIYVRQWHDHGVFIKGVKYDGGCYDDPIGTWTYNTD